MSQHTAEELSAGVVLSGQSLAGNPSCPTCDERSTRHLLQVIQARRIEAQRAMDLLEQRDCTTVRAHAARARWLTLSNVETEIRNVLAYGAPILPDPTDPAQHPNAWSETHPQTCTTCRVCADCFRPRRPDQFANGPDQPCTRCHGR